MPGLFLTLEEPEGGGETTRLARLQARLGTMGIDHGSFRFHTKFLDASQSPDAVAEDLWAAVFPLLSK